MTDLLDYRDRFPILESTTYLINHSLGAMPAAVEERVREYARTWATRGIRAWAEGWWTLPLAVGDQIGRIVGAPQGTVCMHQNVSIAEAIVARAHEAGAHVVLDAYQSAGTVPLDVTALGVDFAVGGSVKWLCGGPGNGWLYVRPHLIEQLEPAYTGWQAHARPFAFEPDLEYAEGIARFLTGTPNVPALYAATPGYDLIEEIGVDRIRANSLRQTQLLIDLAAERGFEIRTPLDPARRGGAVIVNVPDFEAVHKELSERQILCDFRPGAGIRLGPHYFTTDDELRSAIDQIAEILEAGAHERWLGAAARF